MKFGISFHIFYQYYLKPRKSSSLCSSVVGKQTGVSPGKDRGSFNKAGEDHELKDAEAKDRIKKENVKDGMSEENCIGLLGISVSELPISFW